MKAFKNIYRDILVMTGIMVALLSLLLMGCEDKVEITQKYSIMEPVYMSASDVRSSVGILPPVEMKTTGKIYLYKNYILINEPGEGIHIVDNKNPESPEIINFLNIPGNFEMAVRGDRLYADNFMDLVVFDISDINNISISGRVEDIFQDIIYYDQEKGVVVDWQVKEVVEARESEVLGMYPSYYYYNTNQLWFPLGGMKEVDMAYNAPVAQTGKGGSMARFTITGNFLYSIDDYSLQVFNISDLNNPVAGDKISVGWGIETIFPYNDNLFIGSQTGMYIYNNSNPATPVFVSEFSHIQSCDPVVVEGDYAYVTLRSGTTCRSDQADQLDVINISDLNEPKLVKSYPMTSPHGLGIDNGTLFICEGENGLKVFDATDVQTISDHMLKYYEDIDAFDVIPYNDLLIMIGEEGLYQFDYSSPEEINMLSFLPVNSSAK